MPDRIHLTVATVVHREGKFLMVRESEQGHEVINQPAGHVEPGETLQQAALRETLEETGWHVELTGFLGIATYSSPRNGVTYYRVSFAAVPLALDRTATLDPDIIAAEWLEPDALRARPEKLRSPLVLRAVENYLSGPIYPLEIITNEALGSP